MKQELTEKQIRLKRELKIEQKIAVLDRKYSKMIWLRQMKLEAKKEKEKCRALDRFYRLMDIELHNLTAKRKRKIPEDKTIGKVKAKALSKIQEYCKLKRAVIIDGIIKIYVYDTMQFVVLDKKVNWWHVYSQRNYWNLAFLEDNIRPITSWGNRKQLDTTAEWRINLPKLIQRRLESKAMDKLDKNELRDRNFYLWIIEKYSALIEKEKFRLGIL